VRQCRWEYRSMSGDEIVSIGREQPPRLAKSCDLLIGSNPKASLSATAALDSRYGDHVNIQHYLAHCVSPWVNRARV